MNNEKEFKKGFYFGYGQNNFGEEKKLTEELVANLSVNEGCGIALISQKHIYFSKNEIKLNVENNSNEDIYIRIEKKLYNDVKTGIEFIEANNSKDILVNISDEELQEMKELVIAILREDNKAKQYKIKLDIKE